MIADRFFFASHADAPLTRDDDLITFVTPCASLPANPMSRWESECETGGSSVCMCVPSHRPLAGSMHI